MTGMMVTGISIRAVPETVGVKRRRSRVIRRANANWNTEAVIARMASSAGPPACKASTVTAMAALLGPTAST